MPSEVKHPSPQTPTLTTYSCITAARSSYVGQGWQGAHARSTHTRSSGAVGLSFVLLVFSPRLIGPFHLGCCLLGQGVLRYRGAAAGPPATEAASAQQCRQGAGAEGLSLTHRGAAWSPAPSRALPSLIKTLTRRHA